MTNPPSDSPPPDGNSDDRERNRSRFYGWWQAWAGGFIIWIGVFLASLFGISVRDLEIGESTWVMILIIFLPFAGWGIDRRGPRRVLSWMLAGLGGAAVLVVVAPFHLAYLTASGLMVAGSEAVKLPITTAVNNWFRRRRATAMAVAMLPSNVAIVSVIALAAFFTAAGGASQVTLELGIGALIMALAWPLSRLVRNRPEDYGQHPDGVAPEDDAAAWPDYAWREALGARSFWLMTLGQAFVGFGYMAFIVFLPLLMFDSGFPALTRGLVTSLIVLVALPASLIGGMLADRLPIRRVALALAMAVLSGMVVLLFDGTSLPLIHLSAALVGAGTGGMIPLAAAMTGAYFGRTNFATISAITQLPTLLMAFVGPLSVGLIADSIGRDWAISAMVLMAGSGALLYGLLPPPRPSPSQRRQLEMAEATGSDSWPVLRQ